MSNAVVNRSAGAVAAIAGLKRGIQNTRQAIPASSTTPILRMGTDGIWVYGQEDIEVEEGSHWAVNPLSIQHGFVCWTNKAKGEGKNELLGEVYASMSSDPIDPSTLPDKGWPWKAATSVQLKCVSGDDEGEEVIYKPSSTGGANAMQSLLDAIEEQLDTGSDDIVPLVELTNDHYPHKQYGKTYIPIFDFVGWSGLDGPADDEPATEEPDDEPAPAETKRRSRRRTQKAEPEPEAAASTSAEEADEKEAEAPAEQPKTEGRTRRRRRSS